MCRHIHLNMTRSYSPDVDRHPTGGSMFVIGRNLQCNPLVRTRTVNNIKEVQCVDWQQRLSKDICFASFNTQQGVNKSPRTQHRSNQVSNLVAAIQRQRTRSAAAGQVRNAHEQDLVMNKRNSSPKRAKTKRSYSCQNLGVRGRCSLDVQRQILFVGKRPKLRDKISFVGVKLLT